MWPGFYSREDHIRLSLVVPGTLKTYHIPTNPNLQRAIQQVQLQPGYSGCRRETQEKHTKAIWIPGALSHKMPLKGSKGGPCWNCNSWLATLEVQNHTSLCPLVLLRLHDPPFQLSSTPNFSLWPPYFLFLQA